ncbi:MAG: type 1 glutamine amidotransferase domain-containing protein [Candidatus Bathyarchaeota archaeon]|jgi:protease I
MKVLIMVENGVAESEFIYPYYRLQEEGYEVVIVGPKGKETYTGKHGIPFKSDLASRDVNINDFVAVIIPGGRAPDRMRLDKDLIRILKEANEKEKVIAAICHGPQMLIEADLLHDKDATCWKSVATDLKNAGANFSDASVIVDENLVTSRHPGDLPNFCREIIKILNKQRNPNSTT